jgi:hypothetical protein
MLLLTSGLREWQMKSGKYLAAKPPAREEAAQGKSKVVPSKS